MFAVIKLLAKTCPRSSDCQISGLFCAADLKKNVDEHKGKPTTK